MEESAFTGNTGQPYSGFSASNCQAGATCRAGLVEGTFDNNEGPFTYCMYLIGGQWKIDWKCSVGYSAMSLAEYKATQPTKALVFRLLGTLDDYYNFEFRDAKKTHYSVNLRSREGGTIHGYMLKTAKTAESLFTALKDGEEHHINVELRYREGSQDSSVTEITRFVGDSWAETPNGE